MIRQARLAVLVTVFVALSATGCTVTFGLPSSTPSASPSPTASASPSPSGPTQVAPAEIAALYTPATVHLITDLGSGTGFITDASQRIVVTNAHVVAGASTVRALLSSGEPIGAKVLGVAPCEDLAVLQLYSLPPDTPQVILGDSSGLVSGEQVTAIGFPVAFGSEETQAAVTSIGAVQSPDLAAEPSSSLPRYASLIQHDATINPGNSGGPLFDDFGRVVGINTLGNTFSGGRIIQSQYYAISINRARQFIDRLSNGESLLDVGLSGSSLAEAVFQDDDDYDKARFQTALMDRGWEGFVVRSVDADSPAANAGLESDDLIEEVNGSVVGSFADLCNVLASSTGSVDVDGRYLDETYEHEMGESWNVGLLIPE